jgi:hypothetical protein
MGESGEVKEVVVLGVVFNEDMGERGGVGVEGPELESFWLDRVGVIGRRDILEVGFVVIGLKLEFIFDVKSVFAVEIVVAEIVGGEVGICGGVLCTFDEFRVSSGEGAVSKECEGE